MAEEEVREQQYEFTVDELGEYLQKDTTTPDKLMFHSGGDGKVKVSAVDEVLLTSSLEETISLMKRGRLSVGTFYIREGCLIRQRKRWVNPA